MSGLRQHAARLLAAALAIATAVGTVPLHAYAQPVEPVLIEQNVDVSLDFPTPSIETGDPFILNVGSTLAAPAEYFEVRVRVWRPSGSLMYQKTEVRHDVESGLTTIGFEHDLTNLDVAAGRYPVEVRVLATGSEPTVVESRLLVTAQGTAAMPVVVIARVSGPSSLDVSGRFALDPATHAIAREAASGLVTIASSRSDSLSMAISPLLLEEWADIADGYQLSSAEGLQEVPTEDPTPRAYGQTLAALARSADTGQIELLDVPYAEPDLGGLQSIGAVDDLAGHYRLGAETYRQVLGVDPSTGTCSSGDILSTETAGVMAEAGHAYLVASPASCMDPVTPGVYREKSTGTATLVTDPGLAAVVTTGTAEDIYDHLYEAVVAEERPSALVVTLDIGPGQTHTVDDVEQLLALVDRADWLEAIPAARAAQLARQDSITLVEDLPVPEAPAGYWDDVADARLSAEALAQAWDSDGASAEAYRDLLISESETWSGPDGSYPFADRGRSFATSVTRLATDTFGAVTLEAHDVTLAARAGDIPLTIYSTAERDLTLTVVTLARSSQPRSTEQTVAIEPSDNFLTIPVDLGAAVSDHLTVRVMAGDVLVAETTVTVRASYLDRLTTMIAVVLVLVVLLVIIRRRVNRAGAGNMPDDADKHGE